MWVVEVSATVESDVAVDEESRTIESGVPVPEESTPTTAESCASTDESG